MVSPAIHPPFGQRPALRASWRCGGGSIAGARSPDESTCPGPGPSQKFRADRLGNPTRDPIADLLDVGVFGAGEKGNERGSRSGRETLGPDQAVAAKPTDTSTAGGPRRTGP